MAQACVSSSRCVSLLDTTATKSIRPPALLQLPSPCRVSQLASSFKRGSSPLFLWITSRKRRSQRHATSVIIRCEQSAKESNGLGIWLGRLAMVGFATAITVEIATGKGLLENFGFVTPLPTLALVVTALVGVLAAFFIFQSASQD